MFLTVSLCVPVWSFWVIATFARGSTKDYPTCIQSTFCHQTALNPALSTASLPWLVVSGLPPSRCMPWLCLTIWMAPGSPRAVHCLWPGPWPPPSSRVVVLCWCARRCNRFRRAEKSMAWSPEFTGRCWLGFLTYDVEMKWDEHPKEVLITVYVYIYIYIYWRAICHRMKTPATCSKLSNVMSRKPTHARQ